MSEKSDNFVKYIIRICQNSGTASILKNSVRESMEIRAWEFLVSFGINIEFETDRKAYLLIASEIAKNKISTNGFLNLGEAISKCYPPDSTAASSKIRRVLSCQDTDELIMVLPSILSLISSKGLILDYVNLLDCLLWFNFEDSQKKTKLRWANSFYKKDLTDE